MIDRKSFQAGAATMAILAAVVFAIMAILTPRAAKAEDANDIRGTAHGCVDATIPTAWTSLASTGLENSKTGTALGSGLYWTEILIKDVSATVYVCLDTAASCGTGTTNKLSVPASGTIMLPLRGINTKTISLYGTGIVGSTVQVCGYFRSVP